MAHYCRINESNIVQVINVIDDAVEQDEDGHTVEALGAAWCAAFWATSTPAGHRWLKCSYNANIRKNYPGIGYTFDEVRDAFIAEQPYPSWTLDEETCQWQPPTPQPGPGCIWDEENLEWDCP